MTVSRRPPHELAINNLLRQTPAATHTHRQPHTQTQYVSDTVCVCACVSVCPKRLVLLQPVMTCFNVFLPENWPELHVSRMQGGENGFIEKPTTKEGEREEEREVRIREREGRRG